MQTCVKRFWVAGVVVVLDVGANLTRVSADVYLLLMFGIVCSM